MSKRINGFTLDAGRIELFETIDYHRVALTEAGWPIAEKIAGRS